MYLDSQLLILNYQISIYCVNFVSNFVVLVIHSKDSDKRAKYKVFFATSDSYLRDLLQR